MVSGAGRAAPTLGLPDWVTLAVLCYVGVAIFNSLAWLSTEVPEVEPEAAGDDGEAAP